MYYTLLLISEFAKNLYNDWKLVFFLTDPIVILTFIWLVAWIWSSPSAALHTILLKTLKFAFIIIFQFDVWVAAMNNFEIKSKQNSSWCCCCAFIGKKLTNFNFENPNAFLFRNVNYLVLLIFSTKKNHNSI